MSGNKVLILDDDIDWQTRISEFLEDIGDFTPITTDRISTSYKHIVDHTDQFLFAFIDLVLTREGNDKKGLMLIDRLKRDQIKLPCILYSAHLDLNLVLEILMDIDYDGLVAIVDRNDFGQRPWRINKAITKAIEKEKYFHTNATIPGDPTKMPLKRTLVDWLVSTLDTFTSNMQNTLRERWEKRNLGRAITSPQFDDPKRIHQTLYLLYPNDFELEKKLAGFRTVDGSFTPVTGQHLKSLETQIINAQESIDAIDEELAAMQAVTETLLLNERRKRYFKKQQKAMDELADIIVYLL